MRQIGESFEKVHRPAEAVSAGRHHLLDRALVTILTRLDASLPYVKYRCQTLDTNRICCIKIEFKYFPSSV